MAENVVFQQYGMGYSGTTHGWREVDRQPRRFHWDFLPLHLIGGGHVIIDLTLDSFGGVGLVGVRRTILVAFGQSDHTSGWARSSADPGAFLYSPFVTCIFCRPLVIY
jgi:hypothetical protein